jgi:hypothetical protein
MPLVSYYTQQITGYSEELQVIQRKNLLIAICRLISFVAAIIGVYLFIRYGGLIIASATLLFVIAFALLIKWNFRLNDEKALLQKLHFINTNELDILNDQPNRFDNGQQFLSDESFGNDLDIFGQRSLFHLLNHKSWYQSIGKFSSKSLIRKTRY